MNNFNANGNNSVAYNNFLPMPQVPYKIFERLALSPSQSAENLFKILKYAETNALSNPNLTFDEKRNLLWTPDSTDASQQNLFRIFLKPLISSALDSVDEQIQLRIYKPINKALNNINAVLGYQFDMITPERYCMVLDEEDYLVERTDLMEAYILDVLNGSDIGIGSSYFQFYSRDLNSMAGSKLAINNGKSLYGKSMILSLLYANAKSGGGCA
jgi:hypothetical protein